MFARFLSYGSVLLLLLGFNGFCSKRFLLLQKQAMFLCFINIVRPTTKSTCHSSASQNDRMLRFGSCIYSNTTHVSRGTASFPIHAFDQYVYHLQIYRQNTSSSVTDLMQRMTVVVSCCCLLLLSLRVMATNRALTLFSVVS